MTTTPTSGAADLRTAAQAVIDRWDTPLWKDVPATAEYIGRLRAALAAGQATAAQIGAYAALPESFLEIPDVQDESGINAYYSREVVLECIDAALASNGLAPASKIEGLTAAQESLGVEFERVLHDNLFDLYEESQQTASHGQAPAGATSPTEQQILEAAFAPAQPAAQQGGAYAELPEKYYLAGGEVPTWDAKQMHAFADATHTIRASHGQAPATQQAVGNSGFDYKTAADFLSGKTVSDEALRKFVAASRGAHDARAALHAKMLSLQGELASREAEIALLKRSLLDAEADAAAPQPSTTAQSADSVPAVSDLPPLPAPDLRDVGTKPQEIKEFLKGYATEYARTAIAARATADSVQEDLLDAAFEAVRKRLCGVQRYSFVLDDDGLVRRVRDRVGNWIEFDEAHALLDPMAVDAARKQGATP